MSQDGNDLNNMDLINKPQAIRISRVLIKGLLLFLALNILFSFIGSDSLVNLSLYNHLFPGRLRLPFGENPAEAYNFSLNNLKAMFASHEISGRNDSIDEFRVLVIGDSSTWGILLKPDQTLTGIINLNRIECLGKKVRAYNLGYPTLSLTKDILILDQGMSYKPDLIVWPVTLEAFPLDKQLTSPIVAENMDQIRQISDILPDKIKKIIPNKEKNPSILISSIFGQRRQLSDLIRLQLYGSMWAATGIDQYYPLHYEHAQVDLENDSTFHSWSHPEQLENGLEFGILHTGSILAGVIPLLIVNEPILISNGRNSDIRYNFYYPRWAYDYYRLSMEKYTNDNSLQYLDLWDLVPSDEFTNSAIHLTASGEIIYANRIINEIHDNYCQ